MFLNKFLALCLLFPYISTMESKTSNDSILELFHNCKCVEYFRCSEVNKFMFAARANLIPQQIECSDNQFCCEQAKTDSDEDKPMEIVDMLDSAINDAKNHCGMAKTGITVRILTPETDSAATIPGEIPWMVEIFFKPKLETPYKFRCAGSLIHPKVVLTATHCVSSQSTAQLRVIANGRGIFQNLGVNPKDERDVIKIVKHLEYYPGGLYNDIALLILNEEYNFSGSFLNSVCIPETNETFSDRCLVLGWGENNEHVGVPLRKVDVPIIAFGECQNRLRKTHLGPAFNLHSSFVCAGGEEGKDSCRGDGGGPLICLAGNKFVQVGIVSWGLHRDKCGVANEPGIYTKVLLFREWILAELKKYAE